MVYIADIWVNMQQNIKISQWVNNHLAIGQYCFALDYLRKNLETKTDISIRRAIDYLAKQNKIASIYKGFYIIIPPSYKNMGVLPPIMFIDDLMTYLKRPYYVSLLSAASILGAAHQQPQVNYVCTNLPSMRSTKRNGIVIEYISKKNFPTEYIIQKKSDSGYFNVSNPVLTCLDLINYHKKIGGLNRASTVINELVEEISEFQTDVFKIASNADLQRLGYLLEYELEKTDLANQLFELLAKKVTKIKSYPLLSNKSLVNKSKKNRWKINVNTKIEIDD